MTLLTLVHRNGTRLTIDSEAGDAALRVRFSDGRRTLLRWPAAPTEQIVRLLDLVRADYRAPDWTEGDA